jgi:two-component system chemotaxis sensor kinase CheA
VVRDEELLSLFRVESSERLQAIDDALLRLAREPSDAGILEALSREAHSLKGAARMIGASELAAVTHQLEEHLPGRRGEVGRIDPQLLHRLEQCLTAIRALVEDLLNGAPPSIDPQQLAAGLARAAPPASTPEPAVAPAVLPPGPKPPFPAAAVPPPVIPAPAEFRVETVRVEPGKLDALMTHTGELTVTSLRIARRLEQFQPLLDLCEEWQRDLQGRPWSRPGAAGAAGDRGDGIELEHARDRAARLAQGLQQLRGGLGEEAARLGYVAQNLDDQVREIRLLPLSALFGLFPRSVHELARAQGKEVRLVLEGGETTADKRVLEELKDPLMHMLRNAVDHGIEPPEERERAGKARCGTLRLRASRGGGTIHVELTDDGRGIDPERVAAVAVARGIIEAEALPSLTLAQIRGLIFAPGFSTRSEVTDVSGRGVGLDVVRENVERLRGTIEVDSEPGVGCTVRLQLPITVATSRVLIAHSAGQSFAVPVENVEATILVSADDLRSISDTAAAVVGGGPIPVARLAELLELSTEEPAAPSRPGEPAALPCIVLAVGDERFGLLVDQLLDEQEIVLKPLGAFLEQVRNVAGATILGTGEVCVVLNPHDLARSLRRRGVAARRPASEPEARVRSILLVEDSITTRTQEKRILEAAGYRVVVAVDGEDGWARLRAEEFDAVVSDIQMPRLDGLAMTERIRAEARYSRLPIILVSSLASDEDRRRGLEAGADAYIPKPGFDQALLLETLDRLV